MPCTCVVGLQWGDEAKGKIVDILTEEHDFVVRYNGGANAGHTIVRQGQTFKLSILPTGILSPHVTSVVGNGLVVDPEKFLQEVDSLRAAGVSVGSNLVLSSHAHVIFPYHKVEDRLQEGNAAGEAIGTTGRGIGPCYQDKLGRLRGVRVGELLHPDHLKQRLASIVPYKNRLVHGLDPAAETFDADALHALYAGYGEKLRPHVADTGTLLRDALSEGKRLLFEGAQGSLLDVDHGSYPYVTSSSSSVAGVWPGSGVPSRHLDRVIGIIKAYTTRVGGGPFPTELHDAIGEGIRQRGREFGTVTGRPRRCGWFDAVAVRHTAALNGTDELSLMLLDVLSGLDELKVCIAYDLDGERVDRFPADGFLLARCKPVYETFAGWREDISRARELEDLPASARRYIDKLGERIGLPFAFVSIGPDRAQTIRCR
ncbi:MAG: adenylosuccinate synthase [Gemmataceae bacterium]|nr:adenylosuccinate synthase [Gemmataceae bacterium]